jgi:uncharacterized protein (TIGR02246 family)
MKKFLWLFVFALLSLYRVTAMEREEDEKAIQQIVENWINGWASCDAQLAVEGFAEDIEWLNSFGVKKKGSEETKKFLDWVFSLPNAKERKNSETITSVKFIRPEVAVVYSDFHVELQRYLTGEEMADRDGHAIRIFVKEEEKWQMVSMLMVDENSHIYNNCQSMHSAY